MHRYPARLLVPALITLLFFAPALATAGSHQKDVLSAAKRGAIPGFFSQLRDLLSAFWSGTGSILDPNGANGGPSSGPGTEPGDTSFGDNGSGLEPNG